MKRAFAMVLLLAGEAWGELTSFETSGTISSIVNQDFPNSPWCTDDIGPVKVQVGDPVALAFTVANPTGDVGGNIAFDFQDVHGVLHGLWHGPTELLQIDRYPPNHQVWPDDPNINYGGWYSVAPQGNWPEGATAELILQWDGIDPNPPVPDGGGPCFLYVAAPAFQYRQMGDSDRDGSFTSSDLVQVFQIGEYEDQMVLNSSWEDGDWDADREFGSSDLVYAFQDGGYEQAAAAIIPEPSATLLLLFGLLALCFRRPI